MLAPWSYGGDVGRHTYDLQARQHETALPLEQGIARRLVDLMGWVTPEWAAASQDANLLRQTLLRASGLPVNGCRRAISSLSITRITAA